MVTCTGPHCALAESCVCATTFRLSCTTETTLHHSPDAYHDIVKLSRLILVVLIQRIAWLISGLTKLCETLVRLKGSHAENVWGLLTEESSSTWVRREHRCASSERWDASCRKILTAHRHASDVRSCASASLPHTMELASRPQCGRCRWQQWVAHTSVTKRVMPKQC